MLRKIVNKIKITDNSLNNWFTGNYINITQD